MANAYVRVLLTPNQRDQWAQFIKHKGLFGRSSFGNVRGAWIVRGKKYKPNGAKEMERRRRQMKKAIGLGD